MAESLHRLVNTGSFNILQDKLERWCDSYKFNTVDQNVARGCEVIELNARVQGQLFKLLSLCASEGGMYGGASIIKSRLLPILGSGFFATGLSSEASLNVLAEATSAGGAGASLANGGGSTSKGLNDLRRTYEKSLDRLESDLNKTRSENETLRLELEDAKSEIDRQNRASASEKMFNEREMNGLKKELDTMKSENANLRTSRSKTSENYENEIRNLKEDLNTARRHCHLHHHLDECPLDCPVYGHHHHLHHGHHHHLPHGHHHHHLHHGHHHLHHVDCPLDECPVPCGLDDCQAAMTRQLVSHFNDVFSGARLAAMRTLTRYCDDHQNNQKIIHASVLECFHAAKSAFRVYRNRMRSQLALTHTGPGSLEAAVQCHMDRNAAGAVDVFSLQRDVVSALDRRSPIHFHRPASLSSFDVIGEFIRDTARIAWEMAALAHPVDVNATATNGDFFDEKKYRRSYDSDYAAKFVTYYIWPSLVQDSITLAKGEALTSYGGSSGRSNNQVGSERRQRSVSPPNTATSSRYRMSPLKNLSRSPSPGSSSRRFRGSSSAGRRTYK